MKQNLKMIYLRELDDEDIRKIKDELDKRMKWSEYNGKNSH